MHATLKQYTNTNRFGVNSVLLLLVVCLYYWVAIPAIKKPTVASYDFAMVTDLDENSRDPQLFVWYSYLMHNKLQRHENGNYTVELGSMQKLQSQTAKKNRSMELSELINYNGILYAMCDYTGIIFKISRNGKVYQRYAIADGNGNKEKPMKIEWATIKDDIIYIGSIGKEWVIADAPPLHDDAKWIKTLDKHGFIENHDWSNFYSALRVAANASYPGYLIHEAVAWNPNIRKWIFLPRRHSINTPYTEIDDQYQGGNIMLIADEQFMDIKVVTLGKREPEWGFTSVKIIPDSNDMLIVKVREVDGQTKSVITVFDLEGNHKLEPEILFVSDMKFEGLEFL